MGRGRREDPTLDAAFHARRLFPDCAVHDIRLRFGMTMASALPSREGVNESFTSSALRGMTSTRLVATLADRNSLRSGLHEASRRAALAATDQRPLRCASSSRALDEQVLVLLGLPTTTDSVRRRNAARESWMVHASHGISIVSCFLLSAHTSVDERTTLLAEHATYGDLLLLDVPETRQIITRPTRYSNFSRFGRGMPTFKQYAFFQHAAAMLSTVPWIGKIDDDTAPNIGLLVRLATQLRCQTHALIGAINWAGVVPQAHRTGVRNDRCGFGWSMHAALQNYGTSFGTPCESLPCAAYWPACDGLGGVPPFPYGTGAGYIFSSAVLQWVASDGNVIQWVRDAAGPTRGEVQWQKFEDTSTGYWLSYAPFRVHYLNVGRWVHDMTCHPNGASKAAAGGLYRPPTNTTLLVHNLKNGGFHYATELMQRGANEYNHQRCTADMGSVSRAKRRDTKLKTRTLVARMQPAGKAGIRGGGKGSWRHSGVSRPQHRHGTAVREAKRAGHRGSIRGHGGAIAHLEQKSTQRKGGVTGGSGHLTNRLPSWLSRTLSGMTAASPHGELEIRTTSQPGQLSASPSQTLQRDMHGVGLHSHVLRSPGPHVRKPLQPFDMIFGGHYS